MIGAVRAKLNDPDARVWDEVSIVREVNRFAQAMYRDQVDADPSYGRIDYTVAADSPDIRVISDREFHVYFPTWMYRIHDLHDVSGSSRTRLGYVDPHIQRQPSKRWNYSSKRSVRILGFSGPVDLEFSLSKVPGPLHYGAVREVTPGTKKLILDPTPLGGVSELSYEPGSYLGTEFELTTVGTHSRRTRGAIAVCVGQEPYWSSAAEVWTHKLSLMPGFSVPIELGDTYDMHAQVGDENVELLILRAAITLMQKTGNDQGIARLRMDIRQEEMRYKDSLRPRQEQEPLVYRPEGYESISTVDQDQASWID